MREVNATLIGSQQPALDQGNNLVDLGQQVSPNNSLLSDNFVFVTQFGQSPIASPSIGLDNTAGFDTLLNGTLPAESRCIRHTLEPNSYSISFFKLYHYNNQRFTGCSSIMFSWFLSPYVDLIHLDGARETIPSRSYHSAAEFVQPCPGGVITAQTENSLHSECVRSIFLSGQRPYSTKPKLQWLLGVLENRANSNRGSEMTTYTIVQIPLHGLRFLVSTTGSSESFRPAQLEEIVEARFFGGKSLFELDQYLEIVLHTWTYYILSLGLSSAHQNKYIKSFS